MEMEILSPGVRIDARVRPRVQYSAPRGEAELARLRAQVAWLQAERTALWWAVGHDELTGLANRRLFNTVAPSLLREPGQRAAVIVLDLNGFKPINDRFGHEAGDDVLRIVAQRLAGFAGDSLAARLGGDEFAAVLTGPNPQPGRQWWHRAIAILSAAIAEPMAVAGQTLTVTASIGIAPAHGDTPIGELLRRADLAMYRAKVTGSSHVAWDTDAVDGADHPDTSRVVEFALFPAARQAPAGPPAPTCEPARRDPTEVAPADTYRRGDPVWVHRHGDWRPGVVEAASARAVLATYRCAQGQGTVVDTMAAAYVLPRAGVDAQLDVVTARARACETGHPESS